MILSDAVMDWLESFLIDEGLSPTLASEFKIALMRLLIARGSGDNQDLAFIEYFMKHQSEMTAWQVYFFSDVAWIMYHVGGIYRDNRDQKLLGLRRTLSLIFYKSFHLQNANQLALAIVDIGRSTSLEVTTLANNRITSLLRQEKIPGSQLFGTKEVIRMAIQLATVIAQEQSNQDDLT